MYVSPVPVTLSTVQQLTPTLDTHRGGGNAFTCREGALRVRAFSVMLLPSTVCVCVRHTHLHVCLMACVYVYVFGCECTHLC